MKRAASTMLAGMLMLSAFASCSNATDRGATTEAGTALDARAQHDAADGNVQRDAGPSFPVPIKGSDYARYDDLSVPKDRELQLALDVPDDAVSFVLTADPGVSPRSIALVELQGPDGETLFDASSEVNAFDPGTPENLSESLPYTFMLPSSPELPLAAGRYLVRLLVASVDAGGEPPVDVGVVYRRAAMAPTKGALQVVLWFAEGASLSASTAREEPRLREALELWRAHYAQAKITLPPLLFADLIAPDSADLSILDGDAEQSALLDALAAEAGNERVLNVVFVEHLQTTPDKTVRGKVTGLPGPPGHPALSSRGAVIIPLDQLPATASEIARLLAHESAHYLGLRHTSEYDGLRHDPIADTPECPAERASQSTPDGTSFLIADDCADLDGDNLLFYTSAQSALPQATLTPGQAFVLLRNPLVH